ncbi:MAG: ATP-binding protein, partial [Chloroflexi bacterium]|nr:ATP-binding protein [Chloroflexota bacterium]
MDPVRLSSATSSASTLHFLENPPNPRRTIEALREMGYDSYSSVLDLIDNAIDAQASSICIIVSELAGDIVISIEDDGCGMDKDTLSEALRLGSDTERDTADLGKFGMGLVTASIGLSRRVEIWTRQEEGPLFYGGFDLDQIIERNSFVKWVQQAPESDKGLLDAGTGTMVRLSKTDRITNRDASTFGNTLRKKVGQTFRKFLKAGTKIEVNRKM